MADDSKQAEKAYLARAGTDRWERVKPFSSPGHDDVLEGARLIHDFAVALLCLEPKPGERVLDLGAGEFWVSEWLRRFNVETVSVDIAVDMLRVGRDRLGDRAWLVAGDMEQLPLADASVDKAVCLNAFHHVPDGAAALAEIHRVLRPCGRVLLSEPGRGHANAATSVEAVGEWGVQERDVIASALVDACAQAGFARVTLKPLAFTRPLVRDRSGPLGPLAALRGLATAAARRRSDLARGCGGPGPREARGSLRRHARHGTRPHRQGRGRSPSHRDRGESPGGMIREAERSANN